MTQLVVQVKQGEDLNFPMALTTNGQPLDITGATIICEAKKAPYLTTAPMFTKTITETSDSETVGLITYPATGKFEIRFTSLDTSYPPYDYYLVITLILNDQEDIISSSGNNSAIYRVCTQ